MTVTCHNAGKLSHPVITITTRTQTRLSPCLEGGEASKSHCPEPSEPLGDARQRCPLGGLPLDPITLLHERNYAPGNPCRSRGRSRSFLAYKRPLITKCKPKSVLLMMPRSQSRRRGTLYYYSIDCFASSPGYDHYPGLCGRRDNKKVTEMYINMHPV